MAYAFKANVGYEMLRIGLEEELHINIGQNLRLEYSSDRCNYTLIWDQEKGCFVVEIGKGGEVSLKNATTCLCDILAVCTINKSPKELGVQLIVKGGWDDEIVKKIIKEYSSQNALKRLNEKKKNFTTEHNETESLK